jgi:hypothetical protein
MNLVDEDLKDLVHERVHFLMANHFREGGKPHDVAEQDGYLFPFPFDPVFMRQDLLGQPLGKVLLNLGQFFIPAKVFRVGFFRMG